MNKLQELQKKLCPDGVIFKKIDDVVIIKRGERITKNNLVADGEYKVISGGAEPMGFYNKYNREKNTITISSYGYAGYVNFIEENFWANDVCLCVFPKDEIDNKFLYYSLKNLQNYFFSKTTKAIPDHIPTEIIKEACIPVPPMEVQLEVVRILDNLTILTAELTNELTSEFNSRKKQLDFYKNSLFNFDENVDYIEFGDVCDLVTKQTGFDYSKSIKASLIKEKKDNTLPYLQTKFFSGKKFEYETDYYIPIEVAKKFPKILLNQKCILFSIVGASIGNVGLFDGENECFLGGAICVAKVSEKYNIEYIYHYFTSYLGQKQIFSKVKGAGQATVTIEDIRKFRIPLPSVEIQNIIVQTLNNLDELVNSIVEVIPIEIEKRKKQYEYYRDKLLTFKEVETNE